MLSLPPLLPPTAHPATASRLIFTPLAVVIFTFWLLAPHPSSKANPMPTGVAWLGYHYINVNYLSHNLGNHNRETQPIYEAKPYNPQRSFLTSEITDNRHKMDFLYTSMVGVAAGFNLLYV
jgi:hypothetical protein